MSARRYQFILTPTARRDYRSILLYSLQEWGERQQENYEAILNRAFASIEGNPSIGRAREDLPPGCRTYGVEQHGIVY
jgi:plasmid stabilization system protein ParE